MYSLGDGGKNLEILLYRHNKQPTTLGCFYFCWCGKHFSTSFYKLHRAHTHKHATKKIFSKTIGKKIPRVGPDLDATRLLRKNVRSREIHNVESFKIATKTRYKRAASPLDRELYLFFRECNAYILWYGQRHSISKESATVSFPLLLTEMLKYIVFLQFLTLKLENRWNLRGGETLIATKAPLWPKREAPV